MRTLIVATSNSNKLSELREMLPNNEVLGLKDLGIFEEIPETGSTLQENALIKARYLYERLKRPILAEDTGLEVEILNNEPGVFSARYAGVENNAEANINKLLLNLEGKSERKAKFRTVIAFIHEGHEYLFEGEVHGEIGHEKKGTKGFGYDPIFIPEGQDMSFAQMENNKKNSISHRGKALEKFLNWIHSNDSLTLK